VAGTIFHIEISMQFEYLSTWEKMLRGLHVSEKKGVKKRSNWATMTPCNSCMQVCTTSRFTV
jgi:hypothetical protein